jgi:ribonucleases P/MRP protein subunit RPP40
VESGVPQGTLLGPPLFTVYIDDLDEMAELVELMTKFADDMKGLKEITSEADRIALQTTLNRLCEWAKTWQMSFNVAKCKIMHVGRNNPGFKYYMEGEELKTVKEETDVGVLIHSSLKPGRHCEKASNTAGAVLKLIQRNFHYRDRRVLMSLYKSYVRPHLEFASPAWSPWLRADIEKIEKVQKKAVSMVSGLRSETYEERCKEIGIQTLEERRKDQDLAQVYRYNIGTGNIKAETLNERVEVREGARTRLAADPNNFKLPSARNEIRKNAFAVRTINSWNALPASIKMSKNCNTFKVALRNWNETGGRPDQ